MQTDTQLVKKSQQVKQKNVLIQDPCTERKTRCKTLIIHGGKYRTTFTRKYENRQHWVKPNEKHISSYIPGTINELYVKEGDIVKKGDNMLILEAMKMLNTISAPYDALIKKINVSMGDKIPRGYIMIEFE